MGYAKYIAAGLGYGVYKGAQKFENFVDPEGPSFVGGAGKVAMGAAGVVGATSLGLGALGSAVGLNGLSRLNANIMTGAGRFAVGGARFAGKVGKRVAVGKAPIMSLLNGEAPVGGVAGLGVAASKKAMSILDATGAAVIPSGAGLRVSDSADFFTRNMKNHPKFLSFGNTTNPLANKFRRGMDASPLFFGGLTVAASATLGAGSTGFDNARDNTPPGGVGQVRRGGRPDFNHAGVGLKAHYARH